MLLLGPCKKCFIYVVYIGMYYSPRYMPINQIVNCELYAYFTLLGIPKLFTKEFVTIYSPNSSI